MKNIEKSSRAHINVPKLVNETDESFINYIHKLEAILHFHLEIIEFFTFQ